MTNIYKDTMKIHGAEIERPSVEVIVFPRASGDIVFKAGPVGSFEDFEKLYPMPEPKEKILRGGARIKDIDDPAYIKQINEWATAKTHWMMLESLSATEGLTWDTIKKDDPATWKNYTKELEEAGLTEIENIRLIQLIQSACGLSQEKIDKATDNFLATQAEQSAQENSPAAGPSTTPSGEVAS